MPSLSSRVFSIAMICLIGEISHQLDFALRERINPFAVIPLFAFVFMFLLSRFTGSPHEGLYLLKGEGAIFVSIHRLEDFFMCGLKFLQGDRSVAVAIH